MDVDQALDFERTTVTIHGGMTYRVGDQVRVSSSQGKSRLLVVTAVDGMTAELRPATWRDRLVGVLDWRRFVWRRMVALGWRTYFAMRD